MKSYSILEKYSPTLISLVQIVFLIDSICSVLTSTKSSDYVE